MRPTVSVLMSTYGKLNPEWLVQSLESVYSQTTPPDQLVLVIDGPIGEVQEKIIAQYEQDHRIAQTTLVRLPRNLGLAGAMNAGLGDCSGEWIMRMDGDDISKPDRLEIQLRYVAEHSDVDIFSSWSEEFDEQGETAIKSSPVSHDAVIQALRWRNILVHPTILIRASTMRRLEGYRETFGALEDYDLFIRLTVAGARFRVIPTELVRVRVNRAVRVRRGGFRYVWNEIKFRWFAFRVGFLGATQFIMITTAYVAFRAFGGGARSMLYRLVRS